MSVLRTSRRPAQYPDGPAPASPSELRLQVHAWQSRYRYGVIFIDMLCAAFAGAFAFVTRFGMPEGRDLYYLALTLVFPPLWCGLLHLTRAHEPRFLFEGNDEYRKVLVAGLGLMTGIAVVSYAVRLEVPRGWVLILVPLVTLSTLVVRYAWRKRLHRIRWRQGACMRRAVVVGYERAAANLYRSLQRDRFHGIEVVGVCLPPQRLVGDRTALSDHDDVPILGSFDDVGNAVVDVGADVVVVLACPELDGIAMRRLGWELEKTQTDLLVAPALMEITGPRVTVRPVADLPLLHVEHSELTGWRRLLKSSFDKAAAGLGLLLLAPVLLAISLAVKFADGGPVLFRQTRIGQNGREFEMLKFRTMVVDAEDRLADLLAQSQGGDVLFKMHHDPRTTWIGRFLRRYSLDELPQLVNVLRGDMSLVGPRPPLRREVDKYERDVHRRFAVRPGITGLWQVSGRSDLEWEQAVRLDIRYVEQWSLLLDMLIVCRTLGAVLRKSGAY